jgi:hypothetical protein
MIQQAALAAIIRTSSGAAIGGYLAEAIYIDDRLVCRRRACAKAAPPAAEANIGMLIIDYLSS